MEIYRRVEEGRRVVDDEYIIDYKIIKKKKTRMCVSFEIIDYLWVSLIVKITAEFCNRGPHDIFLHITEIYYLKMYDL